MALKLEIVAATITDSTPQLNIFINNMVRPINIKGEKIEALNCIFKALIPFNIIQ